MKQRLRPLVYYYCLLTILCLADDQGGGAGRQEEQPESFGTLTVVSVVRYDGNGDDSQPEVPTLVATTAKPGAFASLEQQSDSADDPTGELHCRASLKYSIRNDTLVCKQLNNDNNTTRNYHDSRMLDNTAESTRTCGPNCRPSCLTMLLDLEKHKPTCELTNCQSCQVTKETPSCSNEKCTLEDAKCLGPMLYDDHVSFLQNYTEFLDRLPHKCSYVPDDPRYNRFRGWPVVHPLEVDCQDSCFDESKLYFEFCNVVQEDPLCDSCGESDCEADCAMHVAPFADGWTSFVVAASIPLDDDTSSCDPIDHTSTGKACWMERIDIFFPSECPYCHECPLLSLGDRFGALEVVGFGHGIGQACAPCDGFAKLDAVYGMRCNELKQCEHLRDCATRASHDLPSFIENQCSWRRSSVREDGIERGDTITVESDPRDNFDDNRGIHGSGDQELSPGLLKQLSTMLPLTIPICLVVVGMLLLSLALMRRSRKRAVAKCSHEEIYYNKDRRFNDDKAIAIFLSDSEDNSSMLAASSQDNNEIAAPEGFRDEPKDTATATSRAKSQASVAAMQFRTASLIHQHGTNEVEVVETTGTHNVKVRWI